MSQGDFNLVIAEFLEDHGIDGILVGKRHITIAELREMHRTPMEQWAEDHQGERIKRPKGWTIYTVTGDVELGWSPYIGAIRQIVLEKEDGVRTSVSMAEAMRMVSAD